MRKQKTGAVLCAICLALTGTPTPDLLFSGTVYAAETELTSDLLKYSVLDGQVMITGTTGLLPETYVIPNEIGGMPVTEIGEKAFQKQGKVVNLTLPNYLTVIGNYAFNDCDALTAVTLPPYVRQIGGAAFSSCDALQAITLNEGLEEIGYSAFYAAKETTLTLPSTLKTIGQGAFAANYKLTAVSIPDSVTEIGNMAFSTCRALETIRFPQNMTVMPGSVCKECDSLTAVTIPETVTEIGEYAFAECKTLKSVTIPEKVTTIGIRAFDTCEALETVTLPDGLETIGEYAFENCAVLSGVKLPAGMKELGSNSFANTALKEAAVPAGLTKLGYSVFTECKALEKITLPDGMTEIPMSFLSNCPLLDHVVIPDSVTKIGSSAFYKDEALADLKVPETITEIGSSAFSYTPFIDALFGGGNFAILNHVLLDSQNCEGEITIPDGVTAIADSAFNDYFSAKITAVTIPESVKKIGTGAFQGQSLIESFTLPETLEEIGARAFSGCRALKSISIPDSVKDQIGAGALDGCKALEEVRLPSGITVIPESMFNGCSSLKTVNLPDGVTVLGKGAFGQCAAMEEIKLPKSLKTIGSGAFRNCSALKNITLFENVTKIETEAFANCLTLGWIGILNPYCEIPMDRKVIYTNSYEAKPQFKGSIYGYADSTAEAYANYYGIDFQLIGPTPTDITTEPAVTTTTGTYTTKQPAVTTVRTTADLSRMSLTKATGTQTTASAAVTAVTTTAPVTTTATTTTIPNAGGLRYHVYYENNDTEKEHGKVIIDGPTADMPYDVVVPAEIEGMPVMRVGGFRECKRLHSIVLPDGAAISSDAFSGCTFLESVRLPADLEIIESGTFAGCATLKQIEIPDTVTEIKDSAFSDCAMLKSVQLPAGLKRTATHVFMGCYQLEPVTLPEGVKNISVYSALDTCYFGHYQDKSLRILTTDIADSLVRLNDFPVLKELIIGEKAARFYAKMMAASTTLRRVVILNPECRIDADSSLKSSSLEEVCGYKGSTAEDFAKEYGIPFTAITDDSDLPELADRETNDLECLTYLVRGDEIVISKINAGTPYRSVITIPEQIEGKPVTEIACSDSTSISDLVKVLNIPKTVNKIDMKWFPYRDNLAAINVDPDNETYSSADGVLFNKDQTELIFYPNAKVCAVYEVPQTVKTINEIAFRYAVSPAFIRIPDGLEEIGWGAFSKNTGLLVMDLSGTNAKLNHNVFSECSALESLQLPQNIEEIPIDLCDTCGALRSVVLPDSVKTIRSSAFVNCRSLPEIKLNDTLEEIDSDAFAGCDAIEEIVLPEKISFIHERTFRVMKNLKSVTVLNPACKIADDEGVICNRSGYDSTLKKNVTYYDGVIRGYSNSPIEAYAKKYGYRFESIGEIPAETTTAPATTAATVTTTSTTRATVATIATPYTFATTTVQTTRSTVTTATRKTTAPLLTVSPPDTTTYTTTTTELVPEKQLERGDLSGNETVGVEDAQLALVAYTEQFAGNGSGLTAAQLKAADINKDGVLGVDDAQLILIYYTETKVAGKSVSWEDLLSK